MIRFFATDNGAVAIEFGIVVSILVPFLLVTVDIAQYLRRRMQVEGVAASVARAVSHTCATALPALTECDSLSTIAADMLAVSSLGRSLALTFDEGEYCVVGGRLERMGNAGVGVTCTSGDSGPGTAPTGPVAGHYLIVTGTYTVEPLFLGKGVGALSLEKIVRTSMLRLQ